MFDKWNKLSANEIAALLDNLHLEPAARQFLEELYWQKVQDQFGPAKAIEIESSSITSPSGVSQF